MLVWIALMLCFSYLEGHELRPAYLELKQIGPEKHLVTWKVPARAPEKRLALTLHFPESCELIKKTTDRYTGEAWLQRFSIQCGGGIEGKTIFIEGLSATLTEALVRLEPLDGAAQFYRITPSEPRFTVASRQNFFEISGLYLVLGIEHILSGVDHLLFILALLILIKCSGVLVGAITAFTIAHSLTLVAATLGFVNIPTPPVEACIALSIVFVAREILRSRQGKTGLSEKHPWVVAFSFGLLHGFGFAGALSGAGLPSHDIPLALLFFNVGVEVGQLFFVGGAILFRRLLVLNRNKIEGAAAYSIGGLSAFWVIQRVFLYHIGEV